MIYREALVTDIQKMHEVRTAVKENRLSDPNRITVHDYMEYMTQRGKGWVCEINNAIVGFAIADLKDNTIWGLFVHPDFEKNGIGKHLHQLMLDWYFQHREKVWLGTAPHSRAEQFYQKQGWTPAGLHGTMEVKFEMTAQDWKQRKSSSSVKAIIKKPEIHEYKPTFQKYIDLVGDGNFPEELEKNKWETIQLFKTIPEEKQNYRYAEKKWTVKEVLMHIIDTERGFSFRTLVGARGDGQMPLHVLDENLYAAHADVTNRSMESLLDEFETVRKSITYLFENLTESQSLFKANYVTYPTTTRAWAYITIGHVKHHNNIIRERYL